MEYKKRLPKERQYERKRETTVIPSWKKIKKYPKSINVEI